MFKSLNSVRKKLVPPPLPKPVQLRLCDSNSIVNKPLEFNKTKNKSEILYHSIRIIYFINDLLHFLQ